MIDHTIGKLVVPIRTANSSGRPNARASHIPTTAPTKPSAIDTRQPPREKPVIACPSAPQSPATISKISRSNNVIYHPLTKHRNLVQETENIIGEVVSLR